MDRVLDPAYGTIILFPSPAFKYPSVSIDLQSKQTDCQKYAPASVNTGNFDVFSLQSSYL